MRSAIFSRSFLLSASLFAACLIIVTVTSCSKREVEPMVVNGPGPAPKLSAKVYNYIDGKDHLGTLGRVLFYDKNLSLNNAISCGSCHKQERAFADDHQFSIGLNNTYSSRNASAILNSPGHNKFWDGRAGDFSTAVFMPVTNHAEMDMFDLNILPEKLTNTTYYPGLFKAAFPNDTVISVIHIREALAFFVENFNSSNSKYDRAYSNFGGIFQNPNQSDVNTVKDVLDGQELLGRNVFFGKGKCYQCHSGGDFNNYSSAYENIGLDVNYEDKGRSKITQTTSDDGKFLVPSLRNIALTAPYMHDGRFKTLREVIDHYSEGIKNSKNLSESFRKLPFDPFFPGEVFFPGDVNFPNVFTPNVDQFGNNPFDIGDSAVIKLEDYPVETLKLTLEEKKALEAFLHTLTDVNFITDPKFSSPF